MDRPTDRRTLETLETLAGERRGAPGRAAVRLDDLSGLMSLETRLQSQKAAGSTPTKAEFDALVNDVHMLHRRLAAVVSALQKRLI
jgi:hypothetical protein